MKKINICKVDVCKNSSHWKNNGINGYCNKHYRQLRFYGKILSRTMYDKNEIIDCGDYYEICLYAGNKEQKEIARTKIDKENLEKVKNYKWHIRSLKSGIKYAVTILNQKQVPLHHLIIGKPKKGCVTDHINTDGLDNRIINLRFATKSQNGMNRNVIGCSWHKRIKKWRARIVLNRKEIFLGNFINKEDAILARREGEKKYFGEFAFNTNIINN